MTQSKKGPVPLKLSRVAATVKNKFKNERNLRFLNNVLLIIIEAFLSLCECFKTKIFLGESWNKAYLVDRVFVFHWHIPK